MANARSKPAFLALVLSCLLAIQSFAFAAPTKAATTAFLMPSSGFMGWAYTPGHNGFDIWTGDPRATSAAAKNPAPCGNEVRAAVTGKIYAVKKFSSYTNAPSKGDAQASVIVMEHTTAVAGLPNPFYTWYLHMANDNGTGTCIAGEVWDKLGQTVPAGFVLGRQGDMRLNGDRITHLHFGISNSGGTDRTSYDPGPHLGVTPQLGEGVIYTGQTIRGTVEPAGERDGIYFFAESGQRATIAMNRTGGNLDSYLRLYGPNGSQVAYDDDSGGSYNSLINGFTLPQAGRYRIETASYNGQSIGNYSLSLTLAGGGGNGGSGATPCGVPGGQFCAEYYNNRTLSGNPTFTRNEGSINYDWSGGGPGNGVGNDNFSARWQGRFGFNGNATFIARADDGIRVYVDGGLVIDAWRDQGPTEYRATRTLMGDHTIKVEYYENGGGAVAQVRWEQSQPGGGGATRGEVTVDDRSGGFSRGGSYWQESGLGVDGHMFWTYANGNATDCWGEWRAGLAGGRYEVYVFIPRDNATTRNARYEITNNGGTATRAVNQNAYYDQWISLGTYDFGSSGRVRLTDATGEAANSYLKVGFDAVRFVPR